MLWPPSCWGEDPRYHIFFLLLGAAQKKPHFDLSLHIFLRGGAEADFGRCVCYEYCHYSAVREDWRPGRWIQIYCDDDGGTSSRRTAHGDRFMETSLRGKIDHCVAQPPVCSTVHPTNKQKKITFFFDNRGDRRGEGERENHLKPNTLSSARSAFSQTNSVTNSLVARSGTLQMFFFCFLYMIQKSDGNHSSRI